MTAQRKNKCRAQGGSENCNRQDCPEKASESISPVTLPKRGVFLKAIKLEIDKTPSLGTYEAHEIIGKIVRYFWDSTKENLDKEDSRKHFDPQFHIRSFSDSGSFELVNPNTMQSLGEVERGFVEMAFAQEEAQYSTHMEEFLGAIEDTASNLLDGAGLDQGRMLVTNVVLFQRAVLDNNYFKVMISIFLTAQFLRTKHALSKLKLANGSIDETILQGTQDVAVHLLANKKWLWVQSRVDRLMLPPHSFMAYERAHVSSLDQDPYGILTDFDKYPDRRNQVSTSLEEMQIGMFPFSKRILLYISDRDLAPHPWLRGMNEHFTIRYSHPSFAQVRTDIFLETNRKEIFEVEYTSKYGFRYKGNRPGFDGIWETHVPVEKTVAVSLSDVLFSDYNRLATAEHKFVYVDQDDFRNGERYGNAVIFAGRDHINKAVFSQIEQEAFELLEAADANLFQPLSWKKLS